MTDDMTCTSCNTMDIGTIIRESDNIATLSLQGENTETLQGKLTELARTVENDPCTINTTATDAGTDMVFTFGCAAEKLIFEMRARPLF